MSRSYKHTPVIKCCGYGRFGKRQANKKVRQTKGLGQKSQSFKRVYETWNIRDYRSFSRRNAGERLIGKEYWEKCYYRK